MIEEQRRRLAELKQKAAAEAQCQWDALHGAAPFPPGPSGFPPLVHHSILHHLPVGREHGEDGEHAYDTLSLESSDSMETSISTGGTSACSPDNMSRYAPQGPALPLPAARRALDAPTLPLPQRQRPGRGQDRGDGEAAERSARGEEPAHGVPGEAAAPAPGASTASLEEKSVLRFAFLEGRGPGHVAGVTAVTAIQQESPEGRRAASGLVCLPLRVFWPRGALILVAPSGSSFPGDGAERRERGAQGGRARRAGRCPGQSRGVGGGSAGSAGGGGRHAGLQVGPGASRAQPGEVEGGPVAPSGRAASLEGRVGAEEAAARPAREEGPLVVIEGGRIDQQLLAKGQKGDSAQF